jgi:pimeloyl-ACP methyl ester carboxylesterase
MPAALCPSLVPYAREMPQYGREPPDREAVGTGPWRERRVCLSDTIVFARERPGRGPVIVFEAGLGLPGSLWRRVCAYLPPDRALLCYDRAGLGRSDRGVLPRSGTRQLGELRELLRELSLGPPYVLVGHSAGAFVVRLFSLEHPEEVAAVVLVDPAHEDEPAARRPVMRWLDASSGALLRAVAALARTGVMEAARRLARGTPLLRRATGDECADLLAEVTSSKHLEGTVHEDRAYSTTVAEIRRAQRQRRMPDVPLRVITAERSYQGWSLLRRSRQRERDRIRAIHGALAASSPHGVHVLAPHSGHLVMKDDPHLVAATVSDVL